MNLTRWQFESLQDLWWMSGHGPYVWACYAITLAVLAWLLISPLVRARRFKRAQQRLLQIERQTRQSPRS